MAGAGRPAGGGGSDLAAWAIPALALVALVVGGALWLAGGLASLLAGAGWQSAPFHLTTLLRVLTEGPGVFWPHADPALLAALTAALAAAVLVPAAVLALRAYGRRPAADDPRRSLARPTHLGPLLPGPAAERALRLRPSLAGVKPRDLAPGDVGVLLGRLPTGSSRSRGQDLFASWEDVALAVMAPRSGKSTALAVPAALAAPGAVVVTSNKPDVWAATSSLRREQTGEAVWVFDPQRVAHAPQTWWWNPLRGLTTVEEAERLAGHFVGTVEDERSRDIWGPAASELLASLLLAAAVSGGSLLDVYGWLSEEASPVPGGVLRENGYPLLARALRGTQDSPAETRGSVYFTARAAAKCLRNPQITAWVTPPDPDQPLVELAPETFPLSRQTLYLLSKDGGGSAAPLVAALTDRVLRAGVAAAEARGGRLDPPMLLVLDEAANVCRIADLPDLYSHLGSRGIVPVTILQSYRQGVAVWGETKMTALWGAATVKLVGPGMDDATFAEDLSRLVGEHDVATVSRSSGGKGGATRTHATRSQRILPAAGIRELPKGSALLLATGTKPALVRLLPWYAGPRAEEIRAATAAAEAEITRHAAGHAGPVVPGPRDGDTQPLPLPDPTP
jgi:type IV secretory pathway TraG/TraD family ATPase VirD4